MVRIAEVFVELVVDERFPRAVVLPHRVHLRRVDMTFGRKCLEFLFAPAVSSLVWFLTKSIRAQRMTTAKPECDLVCSRKRYGQLCIAWVGMLSYIACSSALIHCDIPLLPR